MIRWAFFDAETKIGVMIWRWVFVLPNPFRRFLSDADFAAGKPRWRWPVSMWAKG